MVDECQITEVTDNIRQSLLDAVGRGEPAWFETAIRAEPILNEIGETVDYAYVGSRFTFNFNFDTPETAMLVTREYESARELLCQTAEITFAHK
jgi:hypothetical protein